MGVVNNPQSGEQALVSRSRLLGRLNQPLMPLADAALRDVLSPEAELSRVERKISADVAAADRMPLTGRAADLVDAAVARTRAGASAGDMARAGVRGAELTKRLRMTEQKAQRLGAAQGLQSRIAMRDQEDAEARQAKRNTKSAAISDFVGTLAGAGFAAGMHKLMTKPPVDPLDPEGVNRVITGARGVSEGTAAADTLNSYGLGSTGTLAGDAFQLEKMRQGGMIDPNAAGAYVFGANA